MDALEFLRERKRMCDSYTGCKGCPFDDSKCVIDSTLSDDDDCERIVATVEQWSKEHPRKTRQSVFLEQWPNCMMGDDGVVGMCPRNVDKMYVCNLSQFAECTDCRREFWMQEVE
jgi:hypothetical protein